MSLAEVHISSLIVQVSPDKLAQTKASIEAMPEAEVYGESDIGKLVVVLETQTHGFITDIIEKINNFDGVLTTTMVYHQIDQDPEEGALFYEAAGSASAPTLNEEQA
ncbi:chaperone NapD [Paraferrimonas sp. SM1919]|uniref:chaperone NapD n=1 Tax=Paraferrimonas sp. SM1919 TaxID=2662263 RepID=UPI0013D1FC48|nr:chaperone NapD [Paraferrimonas sp. SM1919]